MSKNPSHPDIVIFKRQVKRAQKIWGFPYFQCAYLLAAIGYNCRNYKDFSSRAKLGKLSSKQRILLNFPKTKADLKQLTKFISKIAEKLFHTFGQIFNMQQLIDGLYYIFIPHTINNKHLRILPNIPLKNLKSLNIGPDDNAVLSQVINLNGVETILIFTRVHWPKYNNMDDIYIPKNYATEFISPLKIIWDNPEIWHKHTYNYLKKWQEDLISSGLIPPFKPEIVFNHPPFKYLKATYDNPMKTHENWTLSLYPSKRKQLSFYAHEGDDDEIFPIIIPDLGSYLVVGFPVKPSNQKQIGNFILECKNEEDNSSLFTINGHPACLRRLSVKDLTNRPDHIEYLNNSIFTHPYCITNKITKENITGLFYITPAMKMDINTLRTRF